MTEEERRIRDTAQRESWPYTNKEANYPLAETAREAQREGRERANA